MIFLWKWLLRKLEAFGKFVLFSYDIVLRIFVGRLRLGLIYEQMVLVAIKSLPITIVTAIFVGMAFTIQIVREFMRFGADEMIGGIVGLAVWRELGPMMTGAVIAGRIGAALASEIGSMKVTEQIEALEVLSQDPLRYLVVPRVIALTLMMPLLVTIADICGFLSGLVVALSTGKITAVMYFNSADIMLRLSDLTGGLLKAFFFGLTISLIGCFFGLRTREGARAVGESTKSSVVVCLITVFILNYILSTLIT